MNIKKIINLKNPENDTEAVNMQFLNSKLSAIHQSGKNIGLEEKYNIINSKQQTFAGLTSHYDNLVSYNNAKDIFLSRIESFPMQTSLNMNNNKIQNITNDNNNDGVVNKGYIDKADTTIKNDIQKLKNDVNNEFIQTQGYSDLRADKSDVDDNIKSVNTKIDNNIKNVNTEITDVVLDFIKTKDKIKTYVDKLHITSSTNLKDEFRYIMEDVDESSSEMNIAVTGIIDSVKSLHTFNNKV